MSNDNQILNNWARQSKQGTLKHLNKASKHSMKNTAFICKKIEQEVAVS